MPLILQLLLGGAAWYGYDKLMGAVFPSRTEQLQEEALRTEKYNQSEQQKALAIMAARERSTKAQIYDQYNQPDFRGFANVLTGTTLNEPSQRSIPANLDTTPLAALVELMGQSQLPDRYSALTRRV